MGETTQPPSWFQPALDRIERAGNALPHPASLLLILCGVVLLLSWVVHAAGVHVTHRSAARSCSR